MHKLASYIMSGRLRAITVVVGFAVLALILPPFALISGAALALVTLRTGPAEGLTILGLSSLAMALLGLAMALLGLGLLGQFWTGLAYSLFQWAPLLVLALVLRYTVSLATTFQVAIALGLLALFGAHYTSPDLPGYWESLLDQYLRPAMIQAEIPTESIDATLHQAAQYMTGSFVASMLLSMVFMLLLARWWQALLYNPGGFREEFTNLNLGYPAALLALGLFITAILSDATLMTELALVSLVMFFLQGVAIVHNLSAKSKNPAIWLIGFYALLIVVLPQMLAAVCVLGLIDTFTNIRARLKGPQQKNN